MAKRTDIKVERLENEIDLLRHQLQVAKNEERRLLRVIHELQQRVRHDCAWVREALFLHALVLLQNRRWVEKVDFADDFTCSDLEATFFGLTLRALSTDDAASPRGEATGRSKYAVLEDSLRQEGFVPEHLIRWRRGPGR